MRIISGKYKGHKLASFDEDHIRPTTDRVKESVFNILAGDLEGARVLDLFSGTGNLGIEALSRGAATVDMVEVNPRSIAIIRKNLEKLKIEEGVQIHRGDAVRFVEDYTGESFDIILIDPPFPLKICVTVLNALSSSQTAGPRTRIAIEHARQEPLPSEIGTNMTCIDTRSYGDKIVAFFEKKDKS